MSLSPSRRGLVGPSFSNFGRGAGGLGGSGKLIEDGMAGGKLVPLGVGCSENSVLFAIDFGGLQGVSPLFRGLTASLMVLSSCSMSSNLLDEMLATWSRVG